MRILIVTADKRECQTFCAILTRAGHECLCAYDGLEAYNQIGRAELPFDICLSAVEVPGLDGFLLKRKLNNENNRLPTIFITDKDILDKELMLKGLAAIRFMPRPIFPEELLTAISKAVQFNRHIRLRPEFLNPIAKLRLMLDGNKIEPDFLLSSSYTIGRSENSDIRIFHRGCSREAGILQRSYEEKDNRLSHYSIVDYNRNGITVNGKRVSSYQELVHGDVIQMAGFEAEYLLLNPSGSPDPKSTMV